MGVSETRHLKESSEKQDAKNQSLPVFIRPKHLGIVIVGGTRRAWELAQSILESVPAVSVKIVSPFLDPAFIDMQSEHPGMQLLQKAFAIDDAEGMQLVFIV